jgi:hypothetical protein
VFSQLLALIGRDLSGLLHIALVSDQDAGDVVRGVLLDLVHPVLDGAEALPVGDVVGHDDTVCALVVGASNGLEALLACSVPLSKDINKTLSPQNLRDLISQPQPVLLPALNRRVGRETENSVASDSLDQLRQVA